MHSPKFSTEFLYLVESPIDLKANVVHAQAAIDCIRAPALTCNATTLDVGPWVMRAPDASRPLQSQEAPAVRESIDGSTYQLQRTVCRNPLGGQALSRRGDLETSLQNKSPGVKCGIKISRASYGCRTLHTVCIVPQGISCYTTEVLQASATLWRGSQL